MVAAWGTGAAINVCGSILINLGTNVMKLGHNRRAACELAAKPPIRAFKAWQLGVGLFIAGNLLNFLSFGFAAQSLLAALGSVQFVSNVFFASFVLGEKVTRRVLAATLCIVCGCVLLVCFGNHQSHTLTVADMLAYYTSPVYIAYLVLLVLLTGGLSFAYHYGQQKLAWVGREAAEDGWVKALPVTYALLSGTVGTQSVLFCKSLSTLLRTTLAGDSQLQSAFFWLTFAAFVATACFWISRLNLALQLFPAILIVPMMQISWTLFSILSGGIYFQEYRSLGAGRILGYCLGVGVVFVGVYLLTAHAGARRRQDLEAGLMAVGPGGEPPGAPLADMPLPPQLQGLEPEYGYASKQQDAGSETASLLGGLGGGSSGLKGLAGHGSSYRSAQLPAAEAGGDAPQASASPAQAQAEAAPAAGPSKAASSSAQPQRAAAAEARMPPGLLRAALWAALGAARPSPRDRLELAGVRRAVAATC